MDENEGAGSWLRYYNGNGDLSEVRCCGEDGSCANGGPLCGGATKLRRRWLRWWHVAVAAVMEVAGAVAGENEEVRWC
ncbi:hypothetical protein DEO72_LG2g3154 [Vigna unguiculata]|uniref:Uncharacterized protein n=1 Tax=Vigna unguiculata TaxID=3917 RepID=A0A4D6L2U5_VIGUN|nr:hypothetical protein DEO72_LG2g3154 [Vigna unguiculata]